MSGVVGGPRSSVFSTMRFSKRKGIFLFENHIKRMKIHSNKLRIEDSSIEMDSILDFLLKNPPKLAEGLLRLECTSSHKLHVTYRPFSIQNDEVDAVTVPSPVWPKRVSGTKHGAWESYIKARGYAEEHGADLALLIHDFSIVDCDRCAPLIVDEDGVLWVSNSDLSVQSITFDLLKDALQMKGYAIQRGHLNERIVARCAEAVAVGSGVGVLKIDSIDGEPIGNGNKHLFELCKTILDVQYQNENQWTEVWK